MIKFIDLVRQRGSVRKYSARPVPREDIEKCLEAARLAPSSQNSQPWRFAVIGSGPAIDDFAKAAFSGIHSATSFAAKATAIVVLLMKKNLLTHTLGSGIQGIDFSSLDMGISGEHLVLQAAELGIGTCWIGWFDVKAAARFLGLPAGWKIAGLIAMGYPEKQNRPQAPNRKPLKELIFKWMDR